MIQFLKRHAGLIGLILVAAVVMVGVAWVDREWSAILRAHKWQALVDFMGQTLFEGDPPGANDPVVIYIVWVIVVYFLIACVRLEENRGMAASNRLYADVGPLSAAYIWCMDSSGSWVGPDRVWCWGMIFRSPNGMNSARIIFPKASTADLFPAVIRPRRLS